MKKIFISPLLFIICLLLCSCGKTIKGPEAQKITPAPNDSDHDLLTDQMEEKLGSNVHISDIPNLILTPNQYHFKINYLFENKNDVIDYQGQVTSTDFYSNEDYYEQLSSFIFKDLGAITYQSSLIDLKVDVKQFNSFIELSEISDLSFHLYTYLNSQKVYLGRDYFMKKPLIENELSFTNLSVEGRILAEMIFQKKPLFIEVSDYHFDHPINSEAKNVSYRELREFTSEKHAKYAVSLPYSEYIFFASETPTEQVLTYFIPDFQNEHYSFSHDSGLISPPKSQVEISQHSFLKMKKEKRERLNEVKISRTNGAASGNSPSITGDEIYYKITASKTQSQYKTEDFVLIYSTHATGITNCQTKVRTLISDKKTVLTEGEILSFINERQSDEVDIQKNESHQWFIRVTPDDHTLNYFWRMQAVTPNKISIGEYPPKCAQYARYSAMDFPETRDVIDEKKAELTLNAIVLRSQ